MRALPFIYAKYTCGAVLCPIINMGSNGKDDIARQYQFGTPINLPETLAAAGIEALEVDGTRVIVIYHQAILIQRENPAVHGGRESRTL